MIQRRELVPRERLSQSGHAAFDSKSSLHHSSVCVFVLALSCLLVLPACNPRGPGSAAFLNENDALRRERNELRDQVQQLEQEHTNLVAEVDLLKQRLDTKRAATTANAGLSAADVPHVARLDFDRYTGTLDRDRDGTPDVIRIYLLTLDQAGRFLPIAAVADIQAVAITPGQPPRTLAEHHLDAPAFQASYRAGLTGAHYTIEAPLAAPSAETTESLDQITVKVTLQDAATGATLSHEQAISLAPRLSTR